MPLPEYKPRLEITQTGLMSQQDRRPVRVSILLGLPKWEASWISTDYLSIRDYRKFRDWIRKLDPILGRIFRFAFLETERIKTVIALEEKYEGPLSCDAESEPAKGASPN